MERNTLILFPNATKPIGSCCQSIWKRWALGLLSSPPRHGPVRLTDLRRRPNVQRAAGAQTRRPACLRESRVSRRSHAIQAGVVRTNTRTFISARISNPSDWYSVIAGVLVFHACRNARSPRW